jgi:hypothetical protein
MLGRHSDRNRREQGMSTIELAIILCIAGLLSAVLGIQLQGMLDHVSLDTAAFELIADLRYARSRAIWERRPVHVSLDQERLLVTILRGTDPPQPLRPPRDLGRRAIQTLRSTGGNLLSFNPRGTSATATTLTLEGRHGDQRVVTVSLTGIVRGR